MGNSKANCGLGGRLGWAGTRDSVQGYIIQLNTKSTNIYDSEVNVCFLSVQIISNVMLETIGNDSKFRRLVKQHCIKNDSVLKYRTK